MNETTETHVSDEEQGRVEEAVPEEINPRQEQRAQDEESRTPWLWGVVTRTEVFVVYGLIAAITIGLIVACVLVYKDK